MYSVVLTTDDLTKEYDLDGDTIDWVVNVENNGDQQATVQLEVENDSGCDSDDDSVSAAVDPATVTLNSGSNQDVDFTITLEDEGETEAGDHCFILRATVTNDPSQTAEDNLTLTGIVPEIRSCEEALDWTFVNLQPGQTSTQNNLGVRNTGNTAWTAAVQAQSSGGRTYQDGCHSTAPPANFSLSLETTGTASHSASTLHLTLRWNQDQA